MSEPESRNKLEDLQLYGLLKEASKFAEKIVGQMKSKDINDVAVVGYLSYSNSLISSARTLYLVNYEKMMRNDIEDYFDDYKVFVISVLEELSNPNRNNNFSAYSEIDKKQCKLLKDLEFIPHNH